MQAWIVARIVAGLAEYRLRLYFFAVVDQHAGSDRTAIRFHTLQLHFQPALFDCYVISQKRGRLIHVDDENVEVAIVIEVSEGASPATVRRGNAVTRLRLQFFKSAVSQIPKQNTRSLVWILRQLAFNFRINT